jgi:hypothetical protein
MPNQHRKVGYILLTLLVVVLVAVVGLVIAYAAGPTGTVAVPDSVYGQNSWLNITPGSDPSQLCFSWATNNQDVAGFVYTPELDVQTSAQGTYPLPVPEVQIVKLHGHVTAANVDFDTNPNVQTFYGVCLQAFVNNAPANPAWYQNKVTVAGLDNSSTYAYRVGPSATSSASTLANSNNPSIPKAWSSTYTFQTQNPNGTFSFIAVGDPQIGANTSGSTPIPGGSALEPSGQASNVLGYDAAGWQNSVAAFTSSDPTASFVVSVGDEIDNQSSQSGADPQYDAYFSPLKLLGLPVATIDGNHDYALGQYYGYHYNQPNQSTQYGVSQFGNDGDYWFRYGNALFMVINDNTISVATHDVFIGQAIAANQDARWRVVCFHHSLYSDDSHTFDNDILLRRSTYPAIFDKYHIDVVLAGHDHSFTRSFQMLGGVPVSKDRMRTAKDGSVTVKDPDGTLYMTLDSGSGSKYYQLNQAYWNPTTGQITYPVYTADYWQQDEPTFSQITVSDNQFQIVTYEIVNGATDQSSQNKQVIDNYTIVKHSGPFPSGPFPSHFF